MKCKSIDVASSATVARSHAKRTHTHLVRDEQVQLRVLLEQGAEVVVAEKYGQLPLTHSLLGRRQEGRRWW